MLVFYSNREGSEMGGPDGDVMFACEHTYQQTFLDTCHWVGVGGSIPHTDLYRYDSGRCTGLLDNIPTTNRGNILGKMMFAFTKVYF